MIPSKTYIKEKGIQAVLLLGLVSVWGCGQGKYNTINYEAPNANSEYVYGNIDGPPLQAGKEYTADPDAGARVNEIRKKMFDNTAATPSGNMAAPSSSM